MELPEYLEQVRTILKETDGHPDLLELQPHEIEVFDWYRTHGYEPSVQVIHWAFDVLIQRARAKRLRAFPKCRHSA